MDEKTLRSTFREAADLVVDLPEGLQAAAFAIAVDRLSDSGQAVIQQRGAKSTLSNRAAGKASRTAQASPRARRRGPKADVESLIAAGYFSGPRSMADVLKHMEGALARRYSNSDMSPTLVRLVRERKLHRERNANGQYEYTAS